MQLTPDEIRKCNNPERLSIWRKIFRAEVELIALDMREHQQRGGKTSDYWFVKASRAKTTLNRRINLINQQRKALRKSNHQSH